MKIKLLAPAVWLIVTVAAAQPPAAVTDGARPGRPIALSAEPFPLSQVRLLNGPFRDAMERDETYLLSLDCDRLLYNFRVNAKLPTQARPYGGWEAPSGELRGHSVGHYLSACSLMYASTGDTRFKERADKIVACFAECQDALGSNATHFGYMSAFPESFIDRVETGRQVWAPWYTLHKIMAGLFDANQLCGNAQALEVLTNMANWVKFRQDRLTVEQMQSSLKTEYGGMNEVLANLYGVTRNADYLKAAEAFNQKSLFDPLAAGDDRLNGLHANTQIPKMIGAARQYELTGSKRDEDIASFFWERVALHRSYVIGGDSDREHFFPTNDFARHLSAETAETCNTYNMLKLTRHLFSWDPSARTMDFYERALYNDILASQDPDQGMFVYLMSLKPGHFKTYSTPENSFWCCVGTGMENHAKYGDTIYFHNDQSLFVNLFIPSELSWPEKGLGVRQETKFPESEATRLNIKAAKPVSLAMQIRWPEWSEKLAVRVNGRSQKISGKPGGYVSLSRTWLDGDHVDIQLAMKLHTEPLPGASNIVAVLYGPVVLAGELGTNGMPNPYARGQTDLVRISDPAVPVFVGDATSILKQIKGAGAPLVFQTRKLGQPNEVTLVPFYRANHERYTVYWNLVSAADAKKGATALSSEAELALRNALNEDGWQ
jgi:DUF1680 family protein